MEIDKQLLEKAILVLGKIDINIEYENFGEFVDKYLKILNTVAITYGRIDNFKPVYIRNSEGDSVAYISYSNNNNNGTFTISKSNGGTKLYAGKIKGRISTFDRDCSDADYFNTVDISTSNSKPKISLNELIVLKPVIKSMIGSIKITFKTLNKCMEELSTELDDLVGISTKDAD